jgi:hypothetical protein
MALPEGAKCQEELVFTLQVGRMSGQVRRVTVFFIKKRLSRVAALARTTRLSSERPFHTAMLAKPGEAVNKNLGIFSFRQPRRPKAT